MEMTKILKPEAVRVIVSASSKKRLFNELGEIANSVYGLDPAGAVEALLERETLGPTGVGHGVAWPHARVENLNEVVGVFVMLEKPIEEIDSMIHVSLCPACAASESEDSLGVKPRLFGFIPLPVVCSGGPLSNVFSFVCSYRARALDTFV